jgi:hypothetical protein
MEAMECQLEPIPFSGWSPYGMSSQNHNSTLILYHFQGGIQMECVHGIIIVHSK